MQQRARPALRAGRRAAATTARLRNESDRDTDSGTAVDPLDGGGQFCDRGDHYRAAIFVGGEDEYRAARASKEELGQSGRFEEPIATEILDRTTFYPAEEYHQNYYRKNPLRYRFYATTCRRYSRLDQVWGDEARPGKN